MREKIVNANSENEALDLCPWGAVAVEVDSGDESEKSFMVFESTADAETWQSQK